MPRSCLLAWHCPTVLCISSEFTKSLHYSKLLNSVWQNWFYHTLQTLKAGAFLQIPARCLLFPQPLGRLFPANLRAPAEVPASRWCGREKPGSLWEEKCVGSVGWGREKGPLLCQCYHSGCFLHPEARSWCRDKSVLPGKTWVYQREQRGDIRTRN